MKRIKNMLLGNLFNIALLAMIAVACFQGFYRYLDGPFWLTLGASIVAVATVLLATGATRFLGFVLLIVLLAFNLVPLTNAYFQSAWVDTHVPCMLVETSVECDKRVGDNRTDLETRAKGGIFLEHRDRELPPVKPVNGPDTKAGITVRWGTYDDSGTQRTITFIVPYACTSDALPEAVTVKEKRLDDARRLNVMVCPEKPKKK